jgi:diguanylate cyclase (GGDEF)-like protein
LYKFVAPSILALLVLTSLVFLCLAKIHVIGFILIIGVSLAIFFYFRYLRSSVFRQLRCDFEKIDERTNLLSKDIEEKKNILKIIPATCERVSYLFNASEKLIGLGDPEEVLDYLVNTLKELFPSADNILLFILHKDALHLARSFKKSDQAIKEKHGDNLEKWILKNNYSLLIDELTQEYRFDCKKMGAFRERGIHSLVGSPLSIGEKILGVVRVESKASHAFSLDDSRLLRSISDLGVVVLERANLLRSMEELAMHDPLTTLFLRDHFFSRLKEEAKRATDKKTELGVLMFDIDDFKRINDTYGHVVGDIVLKRVAKILKEVIGDAGNVICRFGGEEFIALILGADKEKIVSLAQNVRKSVEETAVSFRRRQVCFTVSIGAVAYPKDGIDVLGMVDKADQLLYKAKHEGKNRICFIG